MTTYTERQYSTGPAGSVRASGPLRRWRVVDLVTAAFLGIAFGALFLVWDQVYAALSPLFTAVPSLGGLVSGLWLLPGVVGGLVIRRPGAALFVELLAAFAEMVFGSQWGATVLISGLVQGLGVELVLALVLYRRFTAAVAATAGLVSGFVEIAGYEWWTATWTVQPWSAKLLYLGCVCVSGLVIAGLGGYALVRALAGTGALSAFPPGVEHAERTAS